MEKRISWFVLQIKQWIHLKFDGKIFEKNWLTASATSITHLGPKNYTSACDCRIIEVYHFVPSWSQKICSWNSWYDYDRPLYLPLHVLNELSLERNDTINLLCKLVQQASSVHWSIFARLFKCNCFSVFACLISESVNLLRVSEFTPPPWISWYLV